MLKLACDLKNSSVLIIGTHRNIEVRQSAGLERLIGEIRREGVELSLRGVDARDVAFDHKAARWFCSAGECGQRSAFGYRGQSSVR